MASATCSFMLDTVVSLACTSRAADRQNDSAEMAALRLGMSGEEEEEDSACGWD